MNASYFHSKLAWSFLQTFARTGLLFGFREEQAAKIDRFLRNNGGPSVTLSAPRTPDVLLAVIHCLFYLLDHSCCLQLVLAALAQQHWDDLTNMGEALAKRIEKKGSGYERKIFNCCKNLNSLGEVFEREWDTDDVESSSVIQRTQISCTCNLWSRCFTFRPKPHWDNSRETISVHILLLHGGW